MDATSEVELKELLGLDSRFCLLGQLVENYKDSKKGLRQARKIIRAERKLIEKSELALKGGDRGTLLTRYAKLEGFAKVYLSEKDRALREKNGKAIEDLLEAVSDEMENIANILAPEKSKPDIKNLFAKIGDVAAMVLATFNMPAKLKVGLGLLSIGASVFCKN